MGEDGAWQGSAADGAAATLDQDEAVRLLQQAFCEADIYLNLNVPPRWPPTAAAAPPFAATRPGVLWHCYQVRAHATDRITMSGWN